MTIQEEFTQIGQAIGEIFDLTTLLYILIFSLIMSGILLILSKHSDKKNKKFTENLKVGDNATFTFKPITGEIIEIQDKYVYIKMKIKKHHLQKASKKQLKYDKNYDKIKFNIVDNFIIPIFAKTKIVYSCPKCNQDIEFNEKKCENCSTILTWNDINKK